MIGLWHRGYGERGDSAGWVRVAGDVILAWPDAAAAQAFLDAGGLGADYNPVELPPLAADQFELQAAADSPKSKGKGKAAPSDQ